MYAQGFYHIHFQNCMLEFFFYKNYHILYDCTETQSKREPLHLKYLTILDKREFQTQIQTLDIIITEFNVECSNFYNILGILLSI